MTTDIIIVGQGICGTFLSWYLHKAGLKILVIDEPQPSTATKVASGVINPVTGRQVVTTWMADELMAFTLEAYKQIGNDIEAGVISQKNIIVFPPSQQMRDAYDKRIGEANSYIKQLPPEHASTLANSFYSYYGAAVIDPVWLIDLHPLLQGWRQKLYAGNMLLEEEFRYENLTIEGDSVQYNNTRAGKIFFCNGIHSFQLPYWKNLPFVFNKGEALIVDVPGLSPSNIYKVGNSTIVPWYDGLWWVGSSYENNYADALPTPLFRHKKAQELEMHLKLPFTVVDHLASLRPAVAVERRPFAGFHPFFPAIGILNGMGTKGCSLAPYFAKQLTENLLHQSPIDPLADVKRFRRILQPA
ncbi:MAG TPA: FAD-binding oxidoreductase [Chitinophagaceae bacterium]|nr:FAD-binding oxidoreductase [Chitinophagaceae bacterium]